MEVQHLNGLRLSLPDSLAVSHTLDGFRIQPHHPDELRAPFEILVSLAKGERPAGRWPASRQINGETVYYRVDYEPGGSGGDIRIFSAWKAHSNACVLVKQQVQSEQPLKDEFNLGWSLIAGIRVIAPSH